MGFNGRFTLTAIYGFVSSRNKKAILYSDDLEINNQKQVDKVFLVGDRFAVAIFGQDMTTEAIYVVDHLLEFNKIKISTVAEFANQVAYALQLISKHLTPRYEEALREGTLAQEAWDTVTTQESGIVILDIFENKLYVANVGSCFPSINVKIPPEIETLEEERLHLFAMAAEVAGKKNEQLPNLAITDHETYFKDRIFKDHLMQPKIGNAGAYVSADCGDITKTTVFKSAKHLIDENYKGGRLGYNVTVISSRDMTSPQSHSQDPTSKNNDSIGTGGKKE